MDLWYPGAARFPEENAGTFTGGPYKGVLHTTETRVFPNYAGTAPHFTVMWDGKFHVRQHIPLNRAGRALVNKDGGAQTNRDSVIQIEIVGTCDTSRRGDAGWLYVEDFPREYLAGIRRLMIWVEEQTGIKPVYPSKSKSYPSSYGALNGLRMSATAWDRYNGWCGHQHVPENLHGDPGLINDAFLMDRTGDDEVTKDDIENIRSAVWEETEIRTDSGHGMTARKALEYVYNRVSRLEDAVPEVTKDIIAALPTAGVVTPEQVAEAVAAGVRKLTWVAQ